MANNEKNLPEDAANVDSWCYCHECMITASEVHKPTEPTVNVGTWMHGVRCPDGTVVRQSESRDDALYWVGKADETHDCIDRHVLVCAFVGPWQSCPEGTS